jgi:hypothetical protein
MKLDFDVILALLRSIDTGDASLLTQFDPARVNGQRELLGNGFIEGGVWSRDNRHWDQSNAFLTESGERLLRLSTDLAAWNRAQEAYDAMDQSWSLTDLLNYLETDARRRA